MSRVLVEEFFMRYGICREIATDKGSEFLNETLGSVCKLLNITQLNSVAFHHESIGALEVMHKSMGQYLRIFCGSKKDTWDSWIRYFVFAYNTSVHLSHGYTPYELVFGQQCVLPSNLIAPTGNIEPLYNHDSYAKELKFRLQTAHADAREALLQSKHSTKARYDLKTQDRKFKIGDLVLLRNEAGSKLDPLFTGPYEIVGLNEPNCTLNLPRGQVAVHANRLKLFIV